MGRCVIQTCAITNSAKASANKAVLHSFPNNLERIKVWLLSTGHEFQDLDAYAERILETKNNNHFRICSSHFKPEDYMMKGNVRVFRPDAVPSIFTHVPGKRIINEDVRIRVCKRRRMALPAYPVVTPSSVSETQTSAETVTVQDGETQTDMQYNISKVSPEHSELIPSDLGDFSVKRCYHYVMSTPMKLQEGIVSSRANTAFLKMPFCRCSWWSNVPSETISDTT